MNSGSLELGNVMLRVHNRVLIQGLTLRINPGDVLTVMGESGCGKSCLLAYLCGSLPEVFTASGDVQHAGIELTQLPPESRRLGILFQDDLLFPHMSVGQNLAF